MSDIAPCFRLLLAHKDEGTRKVLESILEDSLGHEVLLSTASGSELVEHYKRDTPDLVVSSLYLEDGDAVRFLIEASEGEPRPSIIITKRGDLKDVERALEDHVMSYLVEPVSADDLRPSIYLVSKRFEEFQELRREVEDLQEALRARKTIEKAKGLLMRTKELDETQAFRRLQETASRTRKKLVEIAEALLLSEKI